MSDPARGWDRMGYDWAWEVCPRNHAKAVHTGEPVPPCKDCERRAGQYAAALQAAVDAGVAQERKRVTQALRVLTARVTERYPSAEMFQVMSAVMDTLQP